MLKIKCWGTQPLKSKENMKHNVSARRECTPKKAKNEMSGYKATKIKS